MNAVGTPSASDNNVIEEAIKANLEDQQTMFSVAGEDGKEHLGFAQLSGYLLTHPFLSANGKLVLAYLAYRAQSFSDLKRCRPTKSKATRADIQRDLVMRRQMVDRALKRLEELEIICKTGRGRAGVTISLQPGPWKKLGDRPVKGSTWRDAMVFNLEALRKRWLKAFQKVEVTLEAARQILQGKELDLGLKTPSKQKEETDRILKLPKQNRFDSAPIRGKKGLIAPTKNRSDSAPIKPQNRSAGEHNNFGPQDVTPESESASGTEQPADSPRAHARTIDIYSKVNQRTTNREPASAGPQLSPGVSRGSPPTLGAEDPEKEPGEHTGFRRCIDGSNNSGRQALQLAEAHALALPKRRKPRKSNPNRAVEVRYRELVEEHFDIILPTFGAGQKAQVKNVVKRYGAETMLKAVDWLFDNWTTLKRNEPKFYGGDKFPPLRALTSYNLMDGYLPYVEKGESLTNADGEYWRQWTSDQEVGRPSEVEVDLIDAQIGGSK